VDVEKFTADLDDPTVDDVLGEDRVRAAAVNVRHAPVVRLNGVTITGDHTLKRFEALVAAPQAATSSGTR
jgi:predicted DsbA family dithiol-disulfide isomerase